MSLIIYGTPQSRTMRTLWVAEELGLSYERRPLAWDDAALKGPDFLRLNPAGSVPTIVDDGFALAESMAINLYLSKKYGSVGASALYPDGPEDEAQVWRWSLWAQSDLEPWVQRDALWSGAVDRIRAVSAPLIQRALTTLDRALVERAWIATDRFTVGDLNVAGVLSPSRSAHLDLQEYTNVTDWLSRCYDRPAARATRARFSARS